MKKEELSKEQYNKILDHVMEAFIKNGVKATTMDSIASTLQMSKRTLYEIFGNKEEIFKEAHTYFNQKIAAKLKGIFADSDNIMEAIVKCFLYNRDLMSYVNVDFIRDMDEYSHQHHHMTEEAKRKHYLNLYDVLNKGVEEGYFRNDINLMVQCHMLTIQMEALKRSEELFSKELSLVEVFDSIILGFLRGIASPKGLEEIERFTPLLSKTISNKSDHKQ